MPQPTIPEDPRLDRRIEFDDRSRRYQVRTLLEALEPAERMRGRGWSPGPVLDQGNEGACVGFGCTHRRNGRPIAANLTEADARAFYHRCLEVDEWPGEADEGTSVLAGMKVGQERGWWSDYYWIGAGSQTPIDDFIDATIDIGPVILGLPWFETMMHPRPSGLLHVSGRIIGGHCLCAPAVRLRMRLRSEWTGTKEVAVLQQSWGLDHGVGLYGQSGGFVFLLLEDLERLLHLQGEGAVPIERR